jgi:hypothetical protein
VKNLSQLSGAIERSFKENSPLILAVAAGVGVLTTAYLTGVASFQAAKVIKAKEDVEGTPTERKERVKERTKLVWKLYIPAGISTATTIGCIVGSNRLGAQKILAAQAALSFTERAYSDYRAKVIEEFSERKDESIRDKVVADQVKRGAPSNEVMITSPGNILCCELFTGRYFVSDMETLKKAVNELNEKLLKRDFMTLDSFYDILGLAQTTESGNIGWKSSKLMELKFSTALTEDNRPCITFEYNYMDLL